LPGAEENIELAAGPTPHGYSQENRESMYRWFNKATGASDAQSEPEIIIEKDETLRCTPQGQVAALKSRTVFDFTAAKAKRLAGKRLPLKGKALHEALRAALRMPETDGPPRVRNLRPKSPKRLYPSPFYMNYAVETEPGIQAIVTMLTQERWNSRPPRATGGGHAILYVSHHSADAELRGEPSLREIIEAAGEGAAVFACDPRGVGESLPGTTTSDPNSYYGPDYFYTIYGNMLGRPYLGGKTHDVLRVIEWLGERGYGNIHLVASGWGTLPATFAALLSPGVVQVTLKNALESYHDIATTEHYAWPVSTFLPGVLKTFDLPDCYRALEAKGLRQIEPLGAGQEPMPAKTA
ncbi:MAG: hypothetical protein ACC661_03445, partial [Verrucomicrobiales bacterium]